MSTLSRRRRTSTQMGIAGALAACLVAGWGVGCRRDEPTVAPVAAAPRAAPTNKAPLSAVARPVPAPDGVPLVMVVSGSVAGKTLDFGCRMATAAVHQSPVPSVTLTEGTNTALLTCRDAATNFELSIFIASPAVGKVSLAPEERSSIVLETGTVSGRISSRTEANSASLNLTAWDPPGGHKAGEFSLSWPADANQLEGQIKGTFKL